MNFGPIDLNQQVFVIAEIGNNHEGDFAVAQELLARAAEAGADAVKFQTFIPEHFVSSSDAARLERLKGFQLSQDQFERLAELASELGVIFFSTPLDIESAKFLNKIQPLFKIASGDNTFFPLIETVANFGKPMIISTGLADMALLERLRDDVKAIWAGKGVSSQLAFLHCVTSYPVPLEQANLGAIRELRARFNDCVIGYSDHTLGTTAAICAVAAGAQIVEKHFTLNKNYSSFRDHQLSADPAEMRHLVHEIRAVKAMMGQGQKVPQSCEQEFMVTARRSVAAAHDIAAGQVLASADIMWVRPGTGVSPGDEARVLGRKATRAIKQGELIRIDDVAGDETYTSTTT